MIFQSPNFSTDYQLKNLKNIRQMKGVDVIEVNSDVQLYNSQGNLCYSGKSATVKVGEKTSVIYLSLTPFIINNVIGKMFKNKR
jgi:hypothetical protein